jgi:hypothetical protein
MMIDYCFLIQIKISEYSVKFQNIISIINMEALKKCLKRMEE